MKTNKTNELIFWLTVKLQFAVSMVRDASMEHNFNKETYYAAQADAYEDILNAVSDEVIAV